MGVFGMAAPRRLRKAVTHYIGQSHATLRIAADIDRCRP